MDSTAYGCKHNGEEVNEWRVRYIIPGGGRHFPKMLISQSQNGRVILAEMRHDRLGVLCYDREEPALIRRHFLHSDEDRRLESQPYEATMSLMFIKLQ